MRAGIGGRFCRQGERHLAALGGGGSVVGVSYLVLVGITSTRVLLVGVVIV